jgi:hypothetical protein
LAIRRKIATTFNCDLSAKSLDEIADEIDQKMDAFELEVATLLESAGRGCPQKENK